MSDSFFLDVNVLLDELLKSGCGVREGLLDMVELCATLRPHDHWKRFLDLPINDDLEQLRSWLTRAFAVPPGPEISGLWFGLFNPRYGEEPTADIYVSGSSYDSGDPDWACGVEWKPPAAYAHSMVLDRIYRLAYPDHQVYGNSPKHEIDKYTEEIALLLCNDAEYPLCLTYSCLAIRRLVTQCDPSLILGGQTSERNAVVGFDSGDSIYLGAITRDGLRARS